MNEFVILWNPDMFIIYEQVNQQISMSEAKATCRSLNSCFAAYNIWSKISSHEKKYFESQLFSKIIYIDDLFYNEISIFYICGMSNIRHWRNEPNDDEKWSEVTEICL